MKGECGTAVPNLRCPLGPVCRSLVAMLIVLSLRTRVLSAPKEDRCG
jgi:hypothetical protein